MYWIRFAHRNGARVPHVTVHTVLVPLHKSLSEHTQIGPHKRSRLNTRQCTACTTTTVLLVAYSTELLLLLSRDMFFSMLYPLHSCGSDL